MKSARLASVLQFDVIVSAGRPAVTENAFVP